MYISYIYILQLDYKPQNECHTLPQVISGQLLMTNAHVVEDAMVVEVKKHDLPKKFRARVVCLGHDVDLALVQVDDERRSAVSRDVNELRNQVELHENRLGLLENHAESPETSYFGASNLEFEGFWSHPKPLLPVTFSEDAFAELYSEVRAAPRPSFKTLRGDLWLFLQDYTWKLLCEDLEYGPKRARQCSKGMNLLFMDTMGLQGIVIFVAWQAAA